LDNKNKNLKLKEKKMKKYSTKKNLTVTIDQEVYLACRFLIEEGKLSETINNFLINFTGMSDNEFFQEKSELKKKKDTLTKTLNEINTKLIIMDKKEKDKEEQSKQETLAVLRGMRMNNPIKKILK